MSCNKECRTTASKGVNIKRSMSKLHASELNISYLNVRNLINNK